jgi:hypothetical protein
MWHAWRGEKHAQGFGGKARRKETTSKTKAKGGGLDQNGPYGDWRGGGRGSGGGSRGSG